MDEPFLHELTYLKVGNRLYAGWLDYALSLTRDDVLDIVDNGLTYQAEALRSMVREIIAGQRVPTKLIKKIDTIVLLSRQKSQELR